MVIRREKLERNLKSVKTEALGSASSKSTVKKKIKAQTFAHNLHFFAI